jgi:hypothetical protein
MDGVGRRAIGGRCNRADYDASWIPVVAVGYPASVVVNRCAIAFEGPLVVKSARLDGVKPNIIGDSSAPFSP